MSNIVGRSKKRRSTKRPHIQIAGQTWKPRSMFAADDLGISDRTARRMNFRTALIGGIAFVPVEESLRDVAARARRRNDPPRRRGRR
jgi:hypothetical protein